MRGITVAAIKIRPRVHPTRPTRLEVRTPMSTKKSHEKEIPPSPLISAADLSANNYVTAPFDDDIALAVRAFAEKRAPDKKETKIWRHQIGFAGELVAATYFDEPVNRTIFPPYVGDDGFDFIHDGSKIEVKTVSAGVNTELKVSADRIQTADYFVLSKCWHPSALVQLVGYASKTSLSAHSYRFPGDDCLRLNREYIRPLPQTPAIITPDDIRESQAL